MPNSHSTTLAAAFSVAAAGALATDSNPLSAVIALCRDLEAKVTKDGEAAQKAYNEYFEWCDDASTEAQHEIETASSQKEKLEAKIEDLTAEIETADSKIADLTSSISKDEQDLKAATSIRKKESADFAANEHELVEAVDTLSRAVGILEKEMKQGSAAFAQLASSSSLSDMLQSLSLIVDAASFPVADKQRLVALVQAQQDAGDEEGEPGAPAAAVYKSHSGDILDVLGDMQGKAEAQLAELRKTEVNSKHNFELLKQSIDDQIANSNKDLKDQRMRKAAAEEGKGAAEGDLATTVADLNDAKKTLSSSQSTCMTVAADHEASIKSRKEELQVLAKAIKILESTTSGAEAQTYSFLQTRTTMQSHTDLARSEVIVALKHLAKKHHSAALAQLASRVAAVASYRSGASDPFAKIRGLIQDMISKLEKEGDAEATEKAYCDDEMAKTSTKKDELESTISKLTTNIDQAAARSTELKDQVTTLQKELAALAKEQAVMDQTRQDEHSTYVKAKADLELGLTGIRKALGVLREYYGAKSEDSAFVQDAGSMQQPAPPQSFAPATGAGGSIIGILEVAESDVASNLAKIETEESDEAQAYETSTQENKVTKAGKDQDVKYKTQEFTTLDKNIADLSGDRDTANTELSAVNDYYAKLKDRCIAKPETYEARKARRDAEIQGLKDALNILENEAALVQRSGKRARHMRGAVLSVN